MVRKEFKLLEKIISNNELTDVIHFVSKGNCGLGNTKNYDILNYKYKNQNNIVIKPEKNNIVIEPEKNNIIIEKKDIVLNKKK